VTESGENLHGRYLIRTFSSRLKVSVRAFIGERSVRLQKQNQWTKLLPRLETFLTTVTVANALPGKTGFPRHKNSPTLSRGSEKRLAIVIGLC
jgi:hypothetical protein